MLLGTREWETRLEVDGVNVCLLSSGPALAPSPPTMNTTFLDALSQRWQVLFPGEFPGSQLGRFWVNVGHRSIEDGL